MAKAVSTNLYIMLSSSDISDRIRSATLSTSYETIDLTTMGATTAAYEKLTGLQDYTLTVTLAQDFGVSDVDSMIWTLFNAGVAFTVYLKFVNTTLSANNAQYTGSVLIDQYDPIAASVGEGHEVTVSMICAGGSKLARAVSA